jgi:hypothetical protein
MSGGAPAGGGGARVRIKGRKGSVIRFLIISVSSRGTAAVMAHTRKQLASHQHPHAAPLVPALSGTKQHPSQQDALRPAAKGAVPAQHHYTTTMLQLPAC